MPYAIAYLIHIVFELLVFCVTIHLAFVYKELNTYMYDSLLEYSVDNGYFCNILTLQTNIKGRRKNQAKAGATNLFIYLSKKAGATKSSDRISFE